MIPLELFIVQQNAVMVDMSSIRINHNIFQEYDT